MVSPMNSPVRLGVSPSAASIPTGVFSQRFEVLFPCWNSGLWGLSHSPVVPPSLSARECGTAWPACCCLAGSTSHCLATSPLCPACPSLPLLSVWMNVFFFNSLVVGLPYSSIFCQFWLLFVFKFIVVLLLVVQGGTVCLLTPPSWPAL